MYCVVSIVDSISATSMPINEFVIYRSVHNYEMKQVLIVCDKNEPSEVVMPDDVDVYLVGTNRKQIREAVKQIKEKYKKYKIVYHAHHQKSLLQFLIATAGMGIRSHLLYTIHSTFSARDIKYRISSSICSFLAKYANCVSQAAFDEYSSTIKWLKGKRLLSIQNGVDVNRIDTILEKKQGKHERNTLICVGRMIPLKNHEFLIRLMEKLPDCSLILVGAEDKEGKIRKLAHELGVLERVEFKGLIPRDAVFAELSNAGIYVSSSYIEGLPVSVLEAMRAGLVPVLSNIKPHEEICNKCNEGIVLPLEIDLWESVIKYYLNMKQTDFEAECLRVKDVVEKHFSLDCMHSAYQEVYEKL